MAWDAETTGNRQLDVIDQRTPRAPWLLGSRSSITAFSTPACGASENEALGLLAVDDQSELPNALGRKERGSVAQRWPGCAKIRFSRLGRRPHNQRYTDLALDLAL
jgi:hypothetical protein